MPSLFAPGQWETSCVRCQVLSPEVRAATAAEASLTLETAGWLGAQPDDGPHKWWCPECRGKLFDGRRRGKKR